MKAVTYIEVDIDRCQLSYGVGACPAVLGTDSATKCYNTIATCPVRNSFDPETLTLRFGMDNGISPPDIDCIPCLIDVSYTPSVVRPGEDLGERATMSCAFRDFPTTDSMLDPYVDERAYVPYNQGSFWGKFRARNPFIAGNAVRLIRGFVGQSLAQMESRHFVIESFGGPGSDGVFKIQAHDILKELDSDRSQAPLLSKGSLTSDISSSATSFVLSPTGIGDIEYPASGYISIGGEEIVSFTRSGDTMTIVRAQYNTEAKDHASGDICQLCLRYDALSPDIIIADLLTSYAAIPSTAIPSDDWATEMGIYIGRLYSALIPTPTPVRDLVNELISQVGLVMWTDEVAQKIRLQALRPVSADAAVYDDEIIREGSLKITEQQSKRISQAWTYFNLKNPLEDLDDPNNYKSAVSTIDADAEFDYGKPAYRVVYSRWINAFNRPAASRLNALLLSRYRDAPRKLSWSLHGGVSSVPELGRGYRVESWAVQLPDGATFKMPVQLTSVSNLGDRYQVTAEELRFSDQDGLDGSAIIFDIDANDINLRDVYDTIYTPPGEYGELSVIIETGIVIGSSSASTPSFAIGDWPDTFSITIINNGLIAGHGGRGGDWWSGVPYIIGGPGEKGGTALYTRRAVTIENNGTIGGGGGGGASNGDSSTSNLIYSGGGGAGRNVGQPGWHIYDDQTGRPGTLLTGGAGGHGTGGVGTGTGGKGGDLGQPGDSGTATIKNFPGGAAGDAIDGDSYITFTTAGTVLGGRVN